MKKEKDFLKVHKTAFKSLVKQNGIRLGSDVTITHFNEIFNVHQTYATLDESIKVLLYEYYIYKIKHKEMEK